jgi:TetR/AcrR family transcriptional regulator
MSMRTSRPQSGRTYDAEASRMAILNAAEVVFAAHGFDGARVDAIAAEAGYNKSLLFQYFGDKLKLYAEVLGRADREAAALRTRLFAPLLEHEDLATDAEQLRAFFVEAFQAIFDHLLSRPHLLRILLWEMAEGWQTYTRISAQLQTEHITQLELLFQKGQRVGLIRSAFSPVIQLTMALHTCQLYLACLPLYQAMLPNQDLSSATAIAQARQHIVTTIVAGILTDPPHNGELKEFSPR